MDVQHFVRSLVLLFFMLEVFFSVSLSRNVHQFHNRHHHLLHEGRGRSRRQAALPNATLGERPPVGDAGPWGAWSESGECSRTCGGGVAIQTRRCRDERSDGSHPCTGASRKYFSCNIQDCPEGSSDFRTEQCEQYDKVAFEGRYFKWIPYLKAPNKCELNCVPKGERFYYRHNKKVIDGTRCDQDSLDICVDGVCLPVGCDMMLGSNAKEDKCRECGGDGSSCKTVEGLFDLDNLQIGYNDILLIPAGATNIYIQERKATNNYLAIRNMTGHYYLNGNWRIDFPRDLHVAGTTFHYERKPHGFLAPESLRALGPTTQPIFIVLLYQETNPGILYEYSIPVGVSTVQPEAYSWIYGDFNECSKSCGGGLQERTVNCAQTTNFKIVADYLCDPLLQPPNKRACNPHPCPPSWHIGDWEECSVTCGGGTQYRMIYCQQVQQGEIPAIVNNNNCLKSTGPRPQRLRKCNEHIKCPEWHAGPWSLCNKMCGEGEQSRLVTCQRTINGRIQVFPDYSCSLSKKPQSKQKCKSGPCEGVDWIVSDWSGCDTCGLLRESRLVHCSNQTGKLFPDDLCDHDRQPDFLRDCPDSPPCDVMWHATEWSECSAKCGTGIQTRIVFCAATDDKTITKVPNDKCNPLKKYDEVRNCTSKPCKGVWFAGPWNRCTSPCGGGHRTRKILCLIEEEQVVDSIHCDPSKRPFHKEECNQHPCDEDEILVSGGCKNSQHGCCPDGVTAAGPNFKGCPKVPLPEGGCETTEFKCCSDGYTPALGPFREGCPTITNCKDTKHGCCPDGITPAKGPNGSSCPKPTTCAVTPYGCCPDGVTPATGKNFAGCEFTPAQDCKELEHGCCADGITPAQGPNSLGCDDEEASGEDCHDSEFGCCPDGLTTATGVNNKGCDEAPVPVVPAIDCEESPHGCCQDKLIPAKGPGFEGCDVTKTTPPSDCYNTLHGCCPDGFTAARGINYEGCASTESDCHLSAYGCCPDGLASANGPNYEGCTTPPPFNCKDTEHGCCPDGSSAARGPNSEGCPCETMEFGCCPDGETSSLGANYEGCGCAVTLYGCCPDGLTEAQGYSYEGCGCHGSTYGCCPDGVNEAKGPNYDGCCDASPFGCCPDQVTLAHGPNFEGCTENGCHLSTYGCCPDQVTPAQGHNYEGCFDTADCQTTTYGCCPDQQTPARGHNYEGCFGTDCRTSAFGCCPDERTPALGHNHEGCVDAVNCHETTYGCCPDQHTPAQGHNYEGCFGSTECHSTTYGCCPDQHTAAQGHNYEGCFETDCRSTTYGCCSDQRTPAQGHNQEGCPGPECQSTAYGCCPDGQTPARGTNYEGCDCRSSPYGCCLDQVTIARGWNNEGCGCADQPHGCCADGQTAARGPSQEGCGCDTTPHGCCPDGVAAATGPNLQGCLESKAPVTKPGEVCGLPKERGPCRNFTVKWFFDMDYGGCSRFWFGGCEGNDNRFDSQEECEHVCVAPEGMDACHLPKVAGPCDNHVIFWYYDVPSGQCGEFYYGGCLGNNNRFNTKEECTETCAKAEIQDPCLQPKVEGPCPGEFLRWYFEKDDGSCKQFRYGGCKGNRNNFENERTCIQQCASRSEKDSCILPKEAGLCSGNFKRWHYDIVDGRCKPFLYGGCQGNNNRFISADQCEQTCNQTKVGDICALAKAEGPCRETLLRWYYDVSEGVCRQFYFGGCEGNANRFETEIECQRVCSSQVTDICSLPSDTGPCKAAVERWFFDKDSGRCQNFIYGGCQGNDNNFGTQMDCEKRCGDISVLTTEDFKTEDCHLEKSYGKCDDNLIRWHYDKVDGVCKQFYYSGCNGNKNRFMTRQECEHHCFHSQDICQLPKVVGPCSGQFHQWFYDAEKDACDKFFFGGCEGNANRFDSQTECETQCSRSATLPPTDPCMLPQDSGPCHSNTPSWYFDHVGQRCQGFVYGGCDGNENRFESEESCERSCGQFRDQDVCSLPEDPGPCLASFPKWYHNPTEKACTSFVYGGCHGNGNRFSSKKECEQECIARKFYDSGNTTVAPDEVCQLPADAGPCAKNLERWYYDSSQGTCDRFIYGGCGGNINRFKKYEICMKFCSAPACQDPRDCHALNCPHGIDQYKDDQGCLKCRCTNPCEDVYCPEGSTCVVESFADNRGDSRGHPVCRKTLDYDTLTPAPQPEEEAGPLDEPSEPPQIEPSDAEVRIRSTHSVNLPCIAHGSPTPEISWRKDGQYLNIDGGRIRISANGTLELHNSTVEDGGVYTCVANNGIGTPAEKSLRLIVEEPASIRPGLRVVVVALGSPCYLHCDAVGYPRPTVTWWRGYIMLPRSSERYNQFQNYTLLINQITQNELGNYSCLAYNGIGDRAKWEIVVQTNDPLPSENIDHRGARQSELDPRRGYSAPNYDNQFGGVQHSDLPPLPEGAYYPDVGQAAEHLQPADQPNEKPVPLVPIAPDLPGSPDNPHTNPSLTNILLSDAAASALLPDIAHSASEEHGISHNDHYYSEEQSSLHNIQAIVEQPFPDNEQLAVATHSLLADKSIPETPPDNNRSLPEQSLSDDDDHNSIEQLLSDNEHQNFEQSLPNNDHPNLEQSLLNNNHPISETPLPEDPHTPKQSLLNNQPPTLLETDNHGMTEVSPTQMPVEDVGDFTTVSYEAVTVSAKIVLSDTNFAVDSNIHIDCKTEGSLQILWYKDGILLQPDPRTQLVENGTLVIYNAVPSDTATYRCEASNTHNVASSSVSVTVDGFQLHPNCTDNPYFANCKLIVKAKYCMNKYYARFCCKSCTLAGQLAIFGPHLPGFSSKK